jgi:hypothetical protein
MTDYEKAIKEMKKGVEKMQRINRIGLALVILLNVLNVIWLASRFFSNH